MTPHPGHSLSGFGAPDQLRHTRSRSVVLWTLSFSAIRVH